MLKLVVTDNVLHINDGEIVLSKWVCDSHHEQIFVRNAYGQLIAESKMPVETQEGEREDASDVIKDIGSNWKGLVGFGDYYQWLKLGELDDLENYGTGGTPQVDGTYISGSMLGQDLIFRQPSGDLGLYTLSETYGFGWYGVDENDPLDITYQMLKDIKAYPQYDRIAAEFNELTETSLKTSDDIKLNFVNAPCLYFNSDNYIELSESGLTIIDYVSESGVTPIIEGTTMKTDVVGWVAYVILSNGVFLPFINGTGEYVYDVNTSTSYTIYGTLDNIWEYKQSDWFYANQKGFFEYPIYERNWNNNTIYQNLPGVLGGDESTSRGWEASDMINKSFGGLQINTQNIGTNAGRPIIYGFNQPRKNHKYYIEIKYSMNSGTCILKSFPTTPWVSGDSLPYTFEQEGTLRVVVEAISNQANLQFLFDSSNVFNIHWDNMKIHDLSSYVPININEETDVLGNKVNIPNAIKGTEKDMIIIAGQSNAVGTDGISLELGYLATNKSMFMWQTGGFASPTSVYGSTNYPTPNVLGYIGLDHSLGLLHGNRINDAYLYKYAVGATSMANDWGVGNTLYNNFKADYDTAKNAENTNLKYMVFYQGEQDATNQTWADNYEQELTDFINDVRTWADSELTIVLVKLHSGSSQTTMPYLNTVISAQENVADSLDNIILVSVDDLTLKTDEVHLDGNSLLELGERIFKLFNSYEYDSLEDFDNLDNELFHAKPAESINGGSEYIIDENTTLEEADVDEVFYSGGVPKVINSKDLTFEEHDYLSLSDENNNIKDISFIDEKIPPEADFTITVLNGVIKDMAVQPYESEPLKDNTGDILYDSNGEKLYPLKEF